MDFNVRIFQIARLDSAGFEADLTAILAYYQDRYFGSVTRPVVAIEFDSLVDGSGKVEMGGPYPIIKLNENLRNFIKFCCITSLHELLNNKLYWQYNQVVAYEDPVFAAGIKDLWNKGAYEGLL